MVFISSDPEAPKLENSLVMLAALIRFAQLDLDAHVRLRADDMAALAARFDEGLDRLLALYQDGHVDAQKREQLREVVLGKAMPAPGTLLAVSEADGHVVRIQPHSDGQTYLGGEIAVIVEMNLSAGELRLRGFERMAAPVVLRR